MVGGDGTVCENGLYHILEFFFHFPSTVRIRVILFYFSEIFYFSKIFYFLKF